MAFFKKEKNLIIICHGRVTAMKPGLFSMFSDGNRLLTVSMMLTGFTANTVSIRSRASSQHLHQGPLDFTKATEHHWSEVECLPRAHQSANLVSLSADLRFYLHRKLCLPSHPSRFYGFTYNLYIGDPQCMYHITQCSLQFWTQKSLCLLVKFTPILTGDCLIPFNTQPCHYVVSMMYIFMFKLQYKHLPMLKSILVFSKMHLFSENSLLLNE